MGKRHAKKKRKARYGPGESRAGKDAKSYFDQLRFVAEDNAAGRVDVNGGVFPRGRDIVGELRYIVDGTEWAAVVTKDTDGDGVPCFRLWYQRGERYQKSGLFPDGMQLVNYIRQAATKNFGSRYPRVDTLGRVRSKNAASVVPDCYNIGPETPACERCPYMANCTTQADPVVAPPPALAEEPESVFLARLRGKVTGGDWED